MSIQIKNINKSFGNFHALKDISLDFPEGKLIALLGPSGCGKTTLLRILAGLENADQGQIFLDGQEATNLQIKDRNVGFMFQHYALFNHLNVFDNIAFGLRVRPKSNRPNENEIKTKVMQLLELMQLAHLSHHFPEQLSGGQKQRVAFARALAIEPKFLLLDEPFGALDAKVRKELRRWLRQLHQDLHISSIFVTHDQEEALEVADQIIVMNNGKVEQIGSPKEIYQSPATPFVFDFIGHSNKISTNYQNSILQIEDNVIEHSQDNLSNGSYTMFVRPENFQVFTQYEPNCITVSLNRELWVGSYVILEVQTTEKQILEVHIPNELAKNVLNLQANQSLWLKPKHLHLFPTH